MLYNCSFSMLAILTNSIIPGSSVISFYFCFFGLVLVLFCWMHQVVEQCYYW